MALLGFIFFIVFGWVETLRYCFHNVPHPEWIEVLIPYILFLIMGMYAYYK